MKLLAALLGLFVIATSTSAVVEVTASGQVGSPALTGFWPAAQASGPLDRMLPDGYANPRSTEEAVRWALSQVGVNRDSGFCLRFVDLAYGRTSGPASAYLVWTRSDPALHHSGLPPRGSLVVWSNAIGRGHGHIAISLGDGTMVSTTGSAVSVLPIRGYADHAYYGWMPPYFYV